MTLNDELFGLPKVDVYKQFASETNGVFNLGDFYNPIKVEVPFKNWTLTFDTNVTSEIATISTGNPYGGNTEYTRVRAVFIKTNDFQFGISNSNIFDSIANLFGSQDIKTGYKMFDELFTIKGNDEIKVKQLLSNATIRNILMQLREVNLKVRTQEGIFGNQLPENVSELFFKAEDVIIIPEKLKLLTELFSEVLDQLCIIECAKSENPNIRLT